MIYLAVCAAQILHTRGFEGRRDSVGMAGGGEVFWAVYMFVSVVQNDCDHSREALMAVGLHTEADKFVPMDQATAAAILSHTRR